MPDCLSFSVESKSSRSVAFFDIHCVDVDVGAAQLGSYFDCKKISPSKELRPMLKSSLMNKSTNTFSWLK